jgi:hypothetical protein
MRRPALDVAAMRLRLFADREALPGCSAASVNSRGPVELDQASVGRLFRLGGLQQQEMASAAKAGMWRRWHASRQASTAGSYIMARQLNPAARRPNLRLPFASGVRQARPWRREKRGDR